MNSRTNHLFSNLIISLILLCLCQSALGALADISRIFHSTPSLNQLEICQGGGCYEVSQTSLSDDDWLPIEQIFSPLANNAEEERVKVSQAVGMLEEIIGNKIGTISDLAGTFDNSNYKGQQDCNDEAINTTTYMRLLQQAGYLQFHSIEDTRTRNFFFTGWPHTTAVIHENATGARFAVDSWFYDNGHPATVVPFAVWKANFQPADSPIGKARETPSRIQAVHVNQ